MAPDERRAAILDAAIPLLRTLGRDVSTKQIADACGIAEGTLFRAFGDRERLIEAAVERALDPAPLRARILAIDPSLKLELKLELVIALMQDRTRDVMGMAHAMRLQRRPMRSTGTGALDAAGIEEALAELLASDARLLALPVSEVVAYLRLVAFGTSVARFNGTVHFDAARLATLVVHGVTAGKD